MFALRTSVAAWLAVATLTTTDDARANPNDISLRGLGRPPAACSEVADCKSDPAVKRYRRLANELTAAMAPRPLAPAETLGMSGFEFALVSTLTPISYDAPYWQGQPGNPVFEGVVRGRQVPKAFWTPTAHLRKGLPLSQEIGIHGSYLAYSEMFSLGGEYKLAIHESMHRWVPALAFRAAFSRLFGASDLDIITGEGDLLVSLPVGVGGMMQVTPYGGYGLLFTDINSQVIDETPYSVLDQTDDQRGGSGGSLYTFPHVPWNENRQTRLFVGVRFIVAMLEVLGEWDHIDIAGPKSVQSWSIKLGLDV